MITKYGIDIVVIALVSAAIILIISYLYIERDWLRWLISVATIVVVALILNFFRDPDRETPTEENIIVSPADGTVVLIKEIYEPDYLKSEALQVSVFMSPLNVHVNRFPMSGEVGYFKHIEGEYIVAFDNKSSERNERTLIGLEKNGLKILFKQIAGTVARRIIAETKVGDKAEIGKRFGMIRFGSRVDVIMPKNSSITVQLNDKVRAGETILGRIPKSSQGTRQ
ncbi:MAG: phosphatidylserine decarboxylase family protein [Ignavibacteriales bacterium]|nr:phosphatidylserine decarboxylase family protein [Ignavibacteriales bacterium]